jgi:type I restriction-modification system DNA methylase subunit
MARTKPFKSSTPDRRLPFEDVAPQAAKPEAEVTLSQLESHLCKATNILRGPLNAADFRTCVFPLLFFLHGIEDFRIERGDTLAEPKLVAGDRLQQFDLFRQEEAEMHRRMVEADVIECVLGLGPNLFCNSPMEACVVVCRTSQPETRKNKVLLINAIGEVTREWAQSFLTDDHIERIVKAYEKFEDVGGFARVVTTSTISEKDGNLSIPLYVTSETTQTNEENAASHATAIPEALTVWRRSSADVRTALAAIPDGASR